MWSDLRDRRLAQGASTLTMQVAGNLFLDRSQRTVWRKAKEALLALEIERQFSKQEILATYCNHVHFGHGLYGLAAAARHYFDKPASALTLSQSATLVGLLPRPASYSPLRSMEKSTRRRNLVLRRMVAEGYLEQDEMDRLAEQPIVVASRQKSEGNAAYFNEEVRRTLQETYGSDELYRGGLLVRTTLDPDLQVIAERAVKTGLAQLDERLSKQLSPARPGSRTRSRIGLRISNPIIGLWPPTVPGIFPETAFVLLSLRVTRGFLRTRSR